MTNSFVYCNKLIILYSYLQVQLHLTKMREVFHVVNVAKPGQPPRTWQVPQKYDNFEILGSGGYGEVCSAEDTSAPRNEDQTFPMVAIKKLDKPLQQTNIHAQRGYRELRMLKHVQIHPHNNIIGLLDAFSPSDTVDTLRDIYMVTPMMKTDLRKALKSTRESNQPLEEDQIKFITYQIVCGMKYIHSSNIIHRY